MVSHCDIRESSDGNDREPFYAKWMKQRRDERIRREQLVGPRGTCKERKCRRSGEIMNNETWPATEATTLLALRCAGFSGDSAVATTCLSQSGRGQFCLERTPVNSDVKESNDA
ncbi:hypothetical protein DBV15_10073 [Temnothorax longispinosus]|uniref:Uncharacterized protein n=1 Tax=Temnothorax longispinosus TaxID=300112 RepID=A0A4S2KWX7_9HYME|nr:hypothetical protein DBV15_10073 [Temnothorax longispinosus]